MTESLEQNQQPEQPKPHEAEGELTGIQLLVIHYACPACKKERFLQGPPFGPPEMIEAFVQGKQLKTQCPGCGALTMLRRSEIQKATALPGLPGNVLPMQPRNRHERRAAEAGGPMVRLR